MPPTNANPLGNAANAASSGTNQSGKDGASMRPPLYNSEDYCAALRLLFTSSLNLPHHPQVSPTSLILEHSTTHPPLIPGQGLIDMNKHQKIPEMSMKKFINGSELLFKLEADLRSAFPSFVQEFVSGESDGVTCILDALRNIHEALDHVQGLREQRKLVLDERSCVQCVALMMRNIDAIPKLLGYAHGLYPIVHCTVSTNTSTRVLALEILTTVCEQGGADAYAKVSEAISTLRLRLGEPIRCKVLVGAISSAAAGTFQATGIRFLRSFIGSAPSAKFRVYLQVELEEAGFNVDVMRKSAELSPARESRLVLQEIDEWDRVCVDVDTVVRQNSQLRNSVATLQQEIATLKDKIKHDNTSTQQQPHHSSSSSSSPPHQKYPKKKPPRPLSCTTPINHITTPCDSEEEAEQIHQILEDLHNIVNNEMLNNAQNDNHHRHNTHSSSNTQGSQAPSEIVPVLKSRPMLPRHYEMNPPRPVRSEPNLFESSPSNTTIEHNSDTDCTGDSPMRVKHVVQQLENSNVFCTLPNFNTSGLASKFANFKSTKLDGVKGGHWGDDPQQENRKVSRSTENLDNFTLKWKYPTPEKSVGGREQANSLVVLQDYRMNRFASGGSGGSKPQKERGSPSSGGGGIFSKNKKRQQSQQVHSHPQKTFQISLVSKQDNKVTNLSYNDLGSNNGGSNGGGGSGGGSSPSLLERVTDLPSGLY